MSIAAAGIALKSLVLGLLEKIPGWIETERQSRREYDIITRFQTDLHKLITMLDHAMERQGDIIEQQQMTMLVVLHLLMDRLQTVAVAGNSLTDSGASHSLIESITSAHRIVVDSFPSLPPPPVEQSTASLEVMVRWQMTSAPYVTMYHYSLQFKDWTILAGVFWQSVLYLAIKGNDPASATVKYRSTMLQVYPATNGDWEDLLKQSLARFDELVELPGVGVQELASRLERHGILS